MSKDWIKVGDDFFSDDLDILRSAWFAVIESWDRVGIALAADRVLHRKDQLSDKNLGGAVIPNSTWRDLALTKLKLSEGKTCFCVLYPENRFFDPEKEQDRGHVFISELEIYREEQFTRYHCKCQKCRNSFTTDEIPGWHVPQWEWWPAQHNVNLPEVFR